MTKSAYTFETIDDNFIIIYDLNSGGMSVTNDIEKIIDELNSNLENICEHVIVYQDSDGIFDGIALKTDGTFSHFYSLGTSNKHQAITAAVIKNKKSALNNNTKDGKVIYDTERGKYWKQFKNGYTNIHSAELGWFSDEQVEQILENAQDEPQSKKQIALNAYCFDFLSSDPERSGGYVMVFAENLNLARDAMFKKHGDMWGTSYTKSQFLNNFPPFMYLYDVIEPVFENEIEK